jgi:5-methylcytosine-specific restriction endonuclease McrA
LSRSTSSQTGDPDQQDIRTGRAVSPALAGSFNTQAVQAIGWGSPLPRPLPGQPPHESYLLLTALMADREDDAAARWAAAHPQHVNYTGHLRSRYWKRLRIYKCVLVGWRCQRCGAETDALQMHHSTGYDVLGTEQLSDLEALCARCHRTEHGLHVASKHDRPDDSEYPAVTPKHTAKRKQKATL